MPPRYAYWTILVDDQPTAFRAATQDDLMPTFKRLKEKNASAKMMWWQNGKLWPSRLDAQEAMRARGEMGRKGDARQGGGFRDRNRDREQRPERDATGKLDWKPKGTSTSEPEGRARPRAEREGGKPSSQLRPRNQRPQDFRTFQSDRPRADEKLEWRPKGDGLAPRDHLLRRNVRENAKPAWKPKGDRKPEWKPKGTSTFRPSSPRAFGKTSRPAESKPRTPRDGKLEWRPKGTIGSEAEGRVRRSTEREGGAPSRPQDPRTSRPPKRQWVPKEEYKKAQGTEVPRDKKWRPGGEHRDPRQKYKDAKKAKWGRFKQNIRNRWEAKQPGGKKRRDEE